jgi:tetrahydromethanopterin S-methyltransferase subunit B
MPALNFQSLLIWALCPVMQLLCVYLLYRRKLLSQFKFLASFLVLQTLNNLVRFLVFRGFGPYSWEYYSIYWVGTALSDMAMIAVLYEIFCAAFKPFAGLQDLAKVVFKWAAGCILFIGFVVLVSTPEATPVKNHWLYLCVSSFERTVRVMECALLMFLFLGAQHLGISKRNRVFGFVLGFGLEAFVNLLILSTLASSHVSKIPVLAPLIPRIYFLSLLIWLGYLIQPEPARESLHIPITSPLLRWNEVALAMGHSGGQVALMNSEPFMPSVERMVEQVMQKEMFVERRQQRVV